MKINLKTVAASSLLAVGAMLGASALSAYAQSSGQGWTGPTDTPPDGNVATPINVSSTTQIKLGNLVINGLSVNAATILNGIVQIPSGNPVTGDVLVAQDTSGTVGWGTASAGSAKVVYKFTTKYSSLMGNADFYAWVGNTTMPKSGGNDHGWYIQGAPSNTHFIATADKLCSYFMTNGVWTGYSKYAGGDYGSDNNNTEYYWSTSTSAWIKTSNGDNGTIDITSLDCIGDGILSRGLPFISL